MDHAEPSAASGASGLLDHIAGRVLEAIAREGPLTPAAVTVLLRNYVATGRDEMAAGLSAALTTALERRPSETLSDDRPAWLLVFLEAQSVSDDERVGAEVMALARALRSEWPARGGLAQAMRSIAACLDAAALGPPVRAARRVQKDPPYDPGVLDGDADSAPLGDDEVGRVLSDPAIDDRLLAAAIDELERIVGGAYEPGEGLLCGPGHQTRGTLEDHVAAAGALLSAYRATARLPYSMLAEELMRVARRHWWLDAGWFCEPSNPDSVTDDAFVVNCEAARVLARISILHADPEYRQAVVVADGAEGVTNFDDADRLLTWLGRSWRAHQAAGPEYAIAFGERLSLR